jgi:hypothetical protein
MTLLELQKELHQSYGVAEFWATTNFGRQQILGDNKFWATTNFRRQQKPMWDHKDFRNSVAMIWSSLPVARYIAMTSET